LQTCWQKQEVPFASASSRGRRGVPGVGSPGPPRVGVRKHGRASDREGLPDGVFLNHRDPPRPVAHSADVGIVRRFRARSATPFCGHRTAVLRSLIE
jgi:hypothetical protein